MTGFSTGYDTQDNYLPLFTIMILIEILLKNAVQPLHARITMFF